MTLQEFIAKYNGHGVDFDGAYGFQCADLAETYNAEVVGAPRIGGNAIDMLDRFPPAFYTRVENTETNHPLPGDVVIWGQSVAVGTGAFGHVAICISGDANGFLALSQNWPEGSVTHEMHFTYTGVKGWGHPKAAVTAPVPPSTGHPSLSAADYAAAAWVSSLQEMTVHVPVGQCLTRKGEVQTWLKAHP